MLQYTNNLYDVMNTSLAPDSFSTARIAGSSSDASGDATRLHACLKSMLENCIVIQYDQHYNTHVPWAIHRIAYIRYNILYYHIPNTVSDFAHFTLHLAKQIRTPHTTHPQKSISWTLIYIYIHICIYIYTHVSHLTYSIRYPFTTKAAGQTTHQM